MFHGINGGGVAFKDHLKAAASKVQDTAKEAQDKAKQARLESKEAEEQKKATQIFQGTSHEEGRNSIVTLYPDRLERVKERSHASLSRAHQDVEVTPLQAVTSVEAKKDKWRTKVTVYASGNDIIFRFGHDEAQRFKEELLRLIVSRGAGESSPQKASEEDVMEKLRKLGELRATGVLTDAEFEHKKSDLLGRI